MELESLYVLLSEPLAQKGTPRNFTITPMNHEAFPNDQVSRQVFFILTMTY